MLIKKSLFLSLLLTSAFMSQSLTGRSAISEYSTVNKECLNTKILNSQDLAIKGTHVIVRVKGFNISDEKILSSVIWVAELLDNYLDSFTQTFNISVLQEYDYRYPGAFKHYGWEPLSFSLWLIEFKGLPKYVKLLKHLRNESSIDVFKQIYGEGLRSLEYEWLKWLHDNYSGSRMAHRSLMVALTKADIVIYDSDYPELKELADYLRSMATYSRIILQGTANASLSVKGLAGSTELKDMLKRHDSMVIVTVQGSDLYDSIIEILKRADCSGIALLEAEQARNASILVVTLDVKSLKRNIVLALTQDPGIFYKDYRNTFKLLYKVTPPWGLDEPFLQGIIVANTTVYWCPIYEEDRWFCHELEI